MKPLAEDDKVVARHRAFWERSPTGEPLIGRLPPAVWKGRPYPICGERTVTDPTPLTPDDIDVDRLLGLDGDPREWQVGDLFRPLGCAYGEAWLEGVIGCPIYASAFGCTARPTGIDARAAAEAFTTDAALQSPWLPVMDAVLARASAVAGDTMPVCQLHLRGVVDMLAAYLGEAQLCTAVYDCPDALERLAEAFADLYIAVAQRGLGLRAPWKGGCVSVWGVYAPGPLVDYQIDASSLFSPETYARHFLKWDRKVLSAFPYPLVHIHATGAHILDVLLDLDEARCIELSSDREAGTWDESRFLALCRKVQSRGKSLLVWSELSDPELGRLLSALSPEGLAVMRW